MGLVGTPFPKKGNLRLALSRKNRHDMASVRSARPYYKQEETMDKRKIYKLTDNLIDLFRVVIELQKALDEIIEGLEPEIETIEDNVVDLRRHMNKNQSDLYFTEED